MKDFFRRLVFMHKPETGESRETEKSLSVNDKAVEIEAVNAYTRSKVLGCFLGLAVGDAKGMPAESKSVEYAQSVADTFNYLPGYLPQGHFTDDTHHSTILAESLLEKETFDADDFMNKLSKLDSRRGIGPTTLKAIAKFMQGCSPDKTGFPSATNGTAMRVAPLAILYRYDPDLLRKYVIASSKVTHTSPISIGGAMTVAFAVAYLLNHSKEKFNKQDFMNQLTDFVNPVSQELAAAFKEDAVLEERRGCHVMESVPHAIRIFMQNPYDFEKAIREAIRGGGDTDTIASIVGALSGAFNGLEAIPAQWVEQLENSPKGRDYIKQIANQLYELSEQKRKTGS